MNKIMSLTKRNCLVFLKDKSAVFFSLLSMLIVLLLMGIFLGKMNVSSIINLLAEYGGERDDVLDQKNAEHLIQYWTLAGLMVVNSLTVTLTVIGTVVTDRTGNKLKSFYTAPVSEFMVAVSYILSAILIGFLFCGLTLVGYLMYIYGTGGTLLTLNMFIKALGYTFANVVIFSLIMYLAALFVKSSSGWGGIGTVVGTLVGFLGAIYVPLGNLPEGVAAVLKWIPVLHGTSLMRKAMCEEVLNTTFINMPPEVIQVYREVMGIDIVVNGKMIGDGYQLLFFGFCGIITLILIVFAAKKQQW